ncbi:MAG: TadE/TadG family type IV pilus assembly protein [Acidimicrobiales bacterium]
MTDRRVRGRAGPAASPTPPARLARHPQARQARQAGQAAVELALILPFVAVLLLLLVQVGLLARDQVLVVHAAREGAREAAVDPSPNAARSAAASSSSLDPGRLEVTVTGRGGPGSRVTVTVRYRAATSLPIMGALVGDLRLEASTTMRVER